jgi:hypothetical protein
MSGSFLFPLTFFCSVLLPTAANVAGSVSLETQQPIQVKITLEM